MNKSLFGSKKAKIICALMTVIILTGIIGMTSKAQTERRASNIKSKGIFDYDNGTVIMDASDLIYLADEIDLLEETYKKETVKALNKMNTYFMVDNSTTHDQDESNLDPESSVILPFGSIIDGILESQSIPTEKTYAGTLPGEDNETAGNVSAATAESISLGRAAWVDGELIVGTGGDNNSYYNKGYANGGSVKFICSFKAINSNQTFDIKSLDNYKTLTEKDFVINVTSIIVNAESIGGSDGNGSILNNMLPSISYNANTGILTLSPTQKTFKDGMSGTELTVTISISGEIFV